VGQHSTGVDNGSPRIGQAARGKTATRSSTRTTRQVGQPVALAMAALGAARSGQEGEPSKTSEL
jgi:hypothetical protein